MDRPAPTPAAIPVSRRQRPAKPPLSRAAIVAAAMGLVDDQGLDHLTMRGVAARLDTGAASLYVYVRNTTELHAAVLDGLLGRVDLAPAGRSWRERLVGLLTSYTEVLYHHASLARMAVFTRPVGPNSMQLVEAVLALLDEGGVAVDRSAWVVDLLLQTATATAAEQALRIGAPDDDLDQLTAVIGSASPVTHPHIVAAGPELVSGAGVERLHWAFEVLINGAVATPRPERANGLGAPAQPDA
jgi:AcrR family transcriptional regulator